jgi:CRP-like cAMP-binding protein
MTSIFSSNASGAHGDSAAGNALTVTAIHRKLASFVGLTNADQDILDEILANRRQVPAGSVLIEEGLPSPPAIAVLDGWAFRCRLFEDGRRQIMRLFLPGDFIGLNPGLPGISSRPVIALTAMTVCALDTHQTIDRLRLSPRLWLAILSSDTRDRSMLEERIASIGRRSAYERLAHILVELYVRLSSVDQAEADRFHLPLTQEHLADLLGLTSIHINRVLGRLKRDGLIAVEGKSVSLLSRDRLMQIADYDPAHLMFPR